MPVDGPANMEISDPSSDSDSDFEEVDASPEDMDLMTQLETDLQGNPNLYDSHVQVSLQCWMPCLESPCALICRRLSSWSLLCSI